MKLFTTYILSVLFLFAPLEGITSTNTEFWLWGVMLSIIDKDCINCGTLARKGPHGLITESMHLLKDPFKGPLNDLGQEKKDFKVDSVCCELSFAAIHYCYFLNTKRDIHPFLGIGIGRASYSLTFRGLELGEEWSELQQPIIGWSDPSIKPSIGVHFGQTYWISLLIQAQGSINFMRQPTQVMAIAAKIDPENPKKLPSYTFSKGITIAIAFKIF